MVNHDAAPSPNNETDSEYQQAFRVCFSNLARLRHSAAALTTGDTWLGVVPIAPSRTEAGLIEVGVQLRPFFSSRNTLFHALATGAAHRRGKYGDVSFCYADAPGGSTYTTYDHELRTDGRVWEREPWLVDGDTKHGDGPQFYPITDIDHVRSLGNKLLLVCDHIA